ncbi:DUF7344 domain-containing protein [Natronobacterium texcoconense]|uniref:DUF7344 domain-containing protein n=1 Tax=Natronobacterium texcoconense TaxID=1095778 RepID=A0A1H1IBC2_NATTX|nr:hypothetical protein [Natronobacterium texcoconense]SDR34952.1 hypothetical protein SAMN04489842_3390 [Natronobacterium texcoconense]
MVEQLRLDRVETPEFLDTIYSVLADTQRRYALQYLLAHSEPVSVHQLANELAELESGTTVGSVSTDQRQEIYLRLKHVHLPLLADTGIVEWDRESERITLSSLLDHLSVSIRNPGGILDISVSTRSEPK